MAAQLTFRIPDEKDVPMIFHMLSRAWAPMKELSDNPVPDTWRDDFKKLEKQLLEQPVVRNNFRMSEHNGVPVGVFQYNLVSSQNTALLGYHCIMSEYRGREFGRQQLEECIRLVFANKLDALDVLTNTHPYFAPALKMYLESGFVEVERAPIANSKYEQIRLRARRPQ
ncbi:MAG: GNAT family N-acetyltransferase [Planctomycetota bacterium]